MDRNQLETCQKFIQTETELDFIKDIYSLRKEKAYTIVLEFFVKTVKINMSYN